MFKHWLIKEAVLICGLIILMAGPYGWAAKTCAQVTTNHFSDETMVNDVIALEKILNAALYENRNSDPAPALARRLGAYAKNPAQLSFIFETFNRGIIEYWITRSANPPEHDLRRALHNLFDLAEEKTKNPKNESIFFAPVEGAKFTLEFDKSASSTLEKVATSLGQIDLYKHVLKTLVFLQLNPSHPSLQTHVFFSLHGPRGEQVYDSYASRGKTGYRIFWYYGPVTKQIVIYYIGPHIDKGRERF